MKQYHTSVIINVSPIVVWNHLAGFCSYAKWNPILGKLEGEMKEGNTIIYAEVKNGKGQIVSLTIQGPEDNVFTAQTLTSISFQIMSDNWKSGFQTPSIFGKEILQSPYQNIIFN